MKGKKINETLYEETRKHLYANGENPDEKTEITRLGLYYYLTDALAEQGVRFGFVGKAQKNLIAEALFMVLIKAILEQVLENVFGRDEEEEEGGGGGRREPLTPSTVSAE